MSRTSSGSTLELIMYIGIALALGGLIVGSVFESAVGTFTNAFGGINASAANMTGAVAGIADVVPIVWILGFLLLFLVVSMAAFKRVRR